MFVTANQGKVATSVEVRPFRLMFNSSILAVIGLFMIGLGESDGHSPLFSLGGIAAIGFSAFMFCIAIRHMYRGARTLLS